MEETKFKSPGVFTRDGMETYFPNLSKEFSAIIDMTNQFPNDQELGKMIRKYLNEYIYKNEPRN